MDESSDESEAEADEDDDLDLEDIVEEEHVAWEPEDAGVEGMQEQDDAAEEDSGWVVILFARVCIAVVCHDSDCHMSHAAQEPD